MSKLAGKFHLIEKVDDMVVVGTLGNISAKKLTFEEKCFIAGFYDVKGENITFEVVDNYSMLDGEYVGGNNDYLIIKKGN